MEPLTVSAASLISGRRSVAGTYSGTAKTDTVIVTLPGGFVDSDNASFDLLFVRVAANTPRRVSGKPID